MGMLWEAHQQSSGRRTDRRQNMRTMGLEQQVQELNSLVEDLEKELGDVVKYLEQKFGEDVNNDGQVSV